jgi:hypothetical protein
MVTRRPFVATSDEPGPSAHRSMILLSSAAAELASAIENHLAFFIKRGMFSEC